MQQAEQSRPEGKGSVSRAKAQTGPDPIPAECGRQRILTLGQLVETKV